MHQPRRHLSQMHKMNYTRFYGKGDLLKNIAKANVGAPTAPPFETATRPDFFSCTLHATLLYAQ